MRGRRWCLNATIDDVPTFVIVTSEGRCDHLDGAKRCREIVGAMLFQMVGSIDHQGQFRYAYRWWGRSRGFYLDASTGRHETVDLGELPGWQDVYPADPPPAVLEGRCPDHGVRYGAAQSMLALAVKDSERTSDAPAPERPATFAFSDNPPPDARPAVPSLKTTDTSS